MSLRFSIKFFPLVALTACAATTLRPLRPDETEVIPRAIFVDNQGRALEPHLDRDGTVMDSATYSGYLGTIIDAIKKSGRHTVILRVHGGLNTLNSNLDATARMTAKILADPRSDAYPIFINWESGLISSYGEHLFRITQGQRYDTFLRSAVFEVYLVADFGRAIARAPFVWGQQFLNFVRSDTTQCVPRDTPSGETVIQETALRVNQPPLTGVANKSFSDIAISKGSYCRSKGESTLYWLKGILLTPVKMVGTIVVDAAGTPAWDNMHRRTKTMFRNPNEFKERPAQISYSRPTGAVSVLLDALDSLARKDPAFRIVLIGHSMGTIIATEIVRTHPDLPFKAIVFMAAANSVREFDVAVVPYLIAHPETPFYNLTLHPLADRREQTMGGIGPNGSLLEWIDAYLANPETDLDRMLGKYTNAVMSAHTFLPKIRGQVHIKAFGYDDPNNCGKDLEPYHHGGFNAESVPFWLSDFWEPGNRPCPPVTARSPQPHS
jgi:pimeloyl-ACP methyl ester carboxylesterase